MRARIDEVIGTRFDDPVVVWVTSIVVGSSLLVLVFDVLKKTIFLNASWNYDYPAWDFVYNVPATVALVVAGLAVIALVPRLLGLADLRFGIATYVIALGLYGLSFFVLPEKTQQFALQPHKGIYYATTYLLDNGLLAYFRDFHSLPKDPSGTTSESMLVTAEFLSETLRSAHYLPFNEPLSEYAASIVHNRHGPMTPILVAPFLLVFGTQIESAILGSYAITAAFPVIAYYTFRIYFDQYESRLGALLVLFSPAFFIYLKEKTIPYDPILGTVSALATYLFLLGLSRRSHLYVGLGGLAFSVAALIKVSAVPLALAFVVIAFVLLDVRSAFEDASLLTVTSLSLPIGLLFTGYNFLVQYLFAIARLFVNAQDFDTQEGSLLFVPPDLNIQNPILIVLATYYNIRLVGLPLLLLAVGFLVYVVWRRELLGQDRYVIGTVFFLPILPILPHMQLQFARHLLGVFITAGFIGVCGLSVLREQMSDRALVRFGQLSLIVTFGLVLINL